MKLGDVESMFGCRGLRHGSIRREVCLWEWALWQKVGIPAFSLWGLGRGEGPQEPRTRDQAGEHKSSCSCVAGGWAGGSNLIETSQHPLATEAGTSGNSHLRHPFNTGMKL